ncbi:MAG: hypothetical protein EXQ58_09175 [Acidobacteria bacterium]|nr:hypothetical protein [Acidobacteriota bacterium]
MRTAPGGASENCRRPASLECVGPTLIECLTYRWFGHHEGDPGTSYPSKEEVEEWKKRDPIRKLREPFMKAMRGTIREAIARGFHRRRTAPPPISQRWTSIARRSNSTRATTK